MKFCLSIIFIFLAVFALSQEDEIKCGTELPKELEQLHRLKQPYSDECFVLPDLNRTLEVHIHYTQDSLGNVIGTNAVADIAAINPYFAPIGIQFAVCHEDTIPNHQMFDWINEMDEPIALAYYYTPKVINLYVTNTIERNGSEVAGYAYFPGGFDMIVYIGGAGTLAHEMGHFFGLMHTFEDGFGLELADGSNCETAGDLICDTEADLDIPGQIDGNCQYIGSNPTDPEGNFYTFPVDNLMSYHPCGCRFTNEQYIKMADQYSNIRFYLW